MSKYVRRLRYEPLFDPHVVHVKWQNPTFSNFQEVRVYRDASLAFVYNPNYLSLLTEVYRGTAESIYDYSLSDTAVVEYEDVPVYDLQEPEEQQKRLEGEKPYKYYVVVIDENGNRFGSENVSITGIPTKYYGTGLELYKQLPEVYKTEDAKLNYPLRRFLQLMGIPMDFNRSVSSMSRLFLNPEFCPRELLPYLYQNYGLIYSNDIPSVFQQRFLSQYGELISNKATRQMLEYLVTELSGGYIASFVEVDSPIDGQKAYKITLSVPGGQPVTSEVQQEVIQRYINDYIPVNVTIELVVLLVRFASGMIDLQHFLDLTMKKTFLFTQSEKAPTYLDGTFQLKGEIYLTGYYYIKQMIEHTVTITEVI